MTNENFYVIKGWMRNVFNLKGISLDVYASVYGFSQDGKSAYVGGIAEMTRWLWQPSENMDSIRRTIKRCLEQMRDSGLIIYEERTLLSNEKQVFRVGKIWEDGIIKVWNKDLKMFVPQEGDKMSPLQNDTLTKIPKEGDKMSEEGGQNVTLIPKDKDNIYKKKINKKEDFEEWLRQKGFTTNDPYRCAWFDAQGNKCNPGGFFNNIARIVTHNKNCADFAEIPESDVTSEELMRLMEETHYYLLSPGSWWIKQMQYMLSIPFEGRFYELFMKGKDFHK